jgi:hypothetical protein
MRKLVRSDWAWKVLEKTLVLPGRLAQDERNLLLYRRQLDLLIRARFADLTVRHGPFKGLRYPSAESLCSALVPKLLGSYERELQPTFETLCRTPYPLVIDIGSAEGYYAVGLARRIPGASVNAFDIDANARDLCNQMAKANGVENRVHVLGNCAPDDLRMLVNGRRALVVCDCEGFELELFTPHVVSALTAADLLVETHDFVGTDITGILVDRFRATHEVSVLTSVDDDSKAREYHYPELDGLEQHARKFALAERRPGLMKWLVMIAGAR